MSAPLGEARMSVEAGGSRFVEHFPLKGDVTAQKVLDVLPKLTAQMTSQMERHRAREGRDEEKGPAANRA